MPLESAAGRPLHTRAQFGKIMRASWGDEALDKVAVHNGLEPDDEGREKVIEFYYRWYLREAGRDDLADARAGVTPGFGQALDVLRDELVAAARRLGPPKPPPTRIEKWMLNPWANARVAYQLWRQERKRKAARLEGDQPWRKP